MIEWVPEGVSIGGAEALTAGAAVALMLGVAVFMRAKVALPAWVTLLLASPLVVGCVAVAKVVSLATPVGFLKAVLALGVVVFFLAGGYGIAVEGPG